MNKELDMGDEGAGGFLKKGIVYKCSPNQLSRATTLPWNGMGLSSKFVRFSAGSLVLYKGLQDPRIWVVASGGQQYSGPVNRLPARKILGFLPPWHWNYSRRR
jgi:hypothetical protein